MMQFGQGRLCRRRATGDLRVGAGQLHGVEMRLDLPDGFNGFSIGEGRGGLRLKRVASIRQLKSRILRALKIGLSLAEFELGIPPAEMEAGYASGILQQAGSGDQWVLHQSGRRCDFG